jgi:hypothetical protein
MGEWGGDFITDLKRGEELGEERWEGEEDRELEEGEVLKMGERFEGLESASGEP